MGIDCWFGGARGESRILCLDDGWEIGEMEGWGDGAMGKWVGEEGERAGRPRSFGVGVETDCRTRMYGSLGLTRRKSRFQGIGKSSPT